MRTRLTILMGLIGLVWLLTGGPVWASGFFGGGGGSGVSGLTANRIPYATSATAMSTDASQGPFVDPTLHFFGLWQSSPRAPFDLLRSALPTAVSIQTDTNVRPQLLIDMTEGNLAAGEVSCAMCVFATFNPSNGNVGLHTGLLVESTIPSSVTTASYNNTDTYRGFLNLHWFRGAGNSSQVTPMHTYTRFNTNATGLVVYEMVSGEAVWESGTGTIADYVNYLAPTWSRATSRNISFFSKKTNAENNGPTYAFYTDDCTALTVSCYGLYAQTDFNIMSGKLRIGSTVDPTVALDVTGNGLISTTLGVGGALHASAIMSATGGTSQAVWFANTTDTATIANVVNIERTRSSATAPVAGFGSSLRFYLEGFTNNSTSIPAAIHAIWENNQTNDTTDRDGALIFFTTLDDNYDGQTVGERWRITSPGQFKGATGSSILVDSLKSATGVRYICVDTTGLLVSQSAACVGT